MLGGFAIEEIIRPRGPCAAPGVIWRPLWGAAFQQSSNNSRARRTIQHSPM
jgi:hypothetical protein